MNFMQMEDITVFWDYNALSKGLLILNSIWFPHGQLWAIVEGKASVILC